MDVETPNYNSDCTYSPTVIGNGTIVTVNLSSSAALKASNKFSLIVLDISGSMSGSKIETCKTALTELVEMLYAADESPKMDIILFNDQPRLLKVQGKSLEECKKAITEIRAGGGTQFIPVFQMIQGILKQDKDIKEIAVLFLSDGQAEPLNSLKPSISDMKDFATKNLTSAELHSLGFGSDHDARLLEELTRCMPTQGSFQYIKESAEISGCIDAISGYLTEKRITAYLQWKEGESLKEKRVNFEARKDKTTSEIKAAWEGIVCLDLNSEEFEKMKGEIKLAIKFEGTSIILSPPFTYKKPEAKAVEIRQNFAFINERLKRIADTMIEKYDAENAKRFREEVSGLRYMLNQSVKEIFKAKSWERPALLDSTKELTEYMDKIGEIIREGANKSLNNDVIATINHMAYRQVTKKKNQKLLDKRYEDNVDLLNEVYKKVQESSAEFQEEELNTKYKDLIEQVGQCCFNIVNMSEALKAEDCLCLTFDLGRPEVAIADASRVIVKKIYPSVICARAFLDCVKHSITLDPNNSGGFDPKTQGEIVKGASNESITAAMPLYLCGEHWKNASQFMKPILGWNVTLDPLGYDYNQVRTVPFLILARALKDAQEKPESEFHKRVTKWVLDTCVQIMKEEIQSNPNNNIAQKTKSTWEKYHIDGTVRGVDDIQSSYVFLAHVACLFEMGYLTKDDEVTFKKKLGYMVEEEMRRRQDKSKVWTASQAKKTAKKLLDINFDTYIDKLCVDEKLDKALEESKESKPKSSEAMKEKEAKFEDIFKARTKRQPKKAGVKSKQERQEENKMQAEGNENKNQDKNLRFKFTYPQDFAEKLKSVEFKANSFPATFGELTGFQKEFASQAFGSYKNAVKQLKSWAKIFDLKEDFEKIESFQILKPVQLFCLHLQNKIHHKNVDRIQSFTDSEYVNPFDENQAVLYFEKIAAQLAYDAWVKEINKKPKEANCPLEDIIFFAETENLKAAAGVLFNGFNLGSFERLQHELKTRPTECKKVLDKLCMIKYGEYDDLSLTFDFKIRKKWLRQLFIKYKDLYKYGEWKEVWFREHIKQNKKKN